MSLGPTTLIGPPSWTTQLKERDAIARILKDALSIKATKAREIVSQLALMVQKDNRMKSWIGKRSEEKINEVRLSRFPVSVHDVEELPEVSPAGEPEVLLRTRRAFEGTPVDFVVSTKLSKNPGEITEQLQVKGSRFIPLNTSPSLGFARGDRPDLKKLYGELQPLQSSFIYLPEEIGYDLISLGTVASYFRECFQTLPIFDFHSPEPGSGKSTSMKVMMYAPALTDWRFCKIALPRARRQLHNRGSDLQGG
jgi:hypothetical protein